MDDDEQSDPADEVNSCADEETLDEYLDEDAEVHESHADNDEEKEDEDEDEEEDLEAGGQQVDGDEETDMANWTQSQMAHYWKSK